MEGDSPCQLTNENSKLLNLSNSHLFTFSSLFAKTQVHFSFSLFDSSEWAEGTKPRSEYPLSSQVRAESDVRMDRWRHRAAAHVSSRLTSHLEALPPQPPPSREARHGGPAQRPHTISDEATDMGSKLWLLPKPAPPVNLRQSKTKKGPGVISGYAWLTSSASNSKYAPLELEAAVLSRRMPLPVSETYPMRGHGRNSPRTLKWKGREHFTVALFNKIYANFYLYIQTCFKTRAADTQTVNTGLTIMLKTC